MNDNKSLEEICKEIDLFLDELTKPANLDDVKISVNKFCEIQKNKPIVLVTVSKWI